MAKKDKTQKPASEEIRPASTEAHSGDDGTAKGGGADDTSASSPAATADNPHTTDEKPTQSAGGADTTAPPAGPGSSEDRAQAKADPGDTNSNDKVAGAGDSQDGDSDPDNSDRGELELYVCRSPIRYAPKGERSRLFQVGEKIMLPGDIANPLFMEGRIGDPE